MRLHGFDVIREARRVRERINLVSGHTNFIWSLSAREILDYHGMLYGLTGRNRKTKIDSLIDLFELRSHANVAYNELSTGLKQRLALAKGLINDPEILFLDEPTVALDPDISIRIREQISALRRARGMTVLLTTHDMPEAELLADEIAFLRGGKILAQGDAESLKRQVKIGDTITMELDGVNGRLDFASIPGVLRYTLMSGRFECVTDSARKRLPELLRLINERGGVARDVRVVEPDLESVFVELVK
jgi:ABC-2 type transport system ATP-binding protein